MREKSCPACCFTGHVFAIGWVFPSSFLSFFVFLLPLFSGFVSPSTSHIPSANMAHSSTYGRTAPERSRSRDDPMWHSHHSQQRGRRYDLRPEVPPAPRLRKVLAIVDLQSVRPLMTKTHDDVMDATTCDLLPSLSRVEERALFTFNVLLNTHRLEYFTVYNLLYCISQHIWYTWDHYLPPSSMDIRWQDETGDTFALRNENRLVDLLHDFRPHWIEGQELGILFPNDIRPFTSHLQPYIMRMSCHEALPNRNLLPWDGSKRFHLHSLSCFWFLFVLLSLVSFPNVSDLLAPFQPLAPAVPWPNVIPCSPASRTLHLRWACHVVIHGDLVVMDIPAALLHLLTYLLLLAVPLIPQLLMLGHPSYLQNQVIIHPTMDTRLQTRPHPSQLLPITRLQFFQDLKKKLIHSRWNWQKLVVSFMHITSSRFKHLKLTIPNRRCADLWWRKWIDAGSIETGSRSSSSMGSSATYALVETVGLTLGINPPNLPTTGDGISKFQKYPRMAIGIHITMKLRKAQYPYKDPAWMIQTPLPPMLTLLRHLSRFNNWQPSSGTFSTMTEMPTWQYSNDSRIQMMTWQDIRSRSSRQQTWLTLPVIWQNLLAHCQIKPFEWRHFQTSAIEPAHRGVLSCRNNKSFPNHSANDKK